MKAYYTKGLLIFAIVVLAGMNIMQAMQSRNVAGFSCAGNLKFVDPSLNCASSDDSEIEQIHSLESKLLDHTNEYIKKGTGRHISIFFRDLTTRRFVSIYKNKSYTPASLLKLPVLMAYFKFAEVNPDILNVKIRYQKTSELSDSREEGEYPLDYDKEYTIEELLKHMIVASDNNATSLLVSYLEKIAPGFKEKIFKDLGLKIPGTEDVFINFVTVENYAAILRSLYLSSYLQYQWSEKALAWMNETFFTKGLVAGMPQETRLSHKYGVRTGIDQVTREIFVQLHDCGIVYSPGKPYILCVMTEGRSEEELAGIIRDISNLVYNEVTEK